MDGADPGVWRNLLGRADSGELYLDPETGKGLDKVCDDHVRKLESVLRSARFLSRITGFGDFDSGRILEKKFSALASGDDRALDTVLEQHIEAINITKEVVAKAIANYVALDDEQRAEIEKLKP